MRPAKPFPFVADHPFVYIKRSNRTGEILFMGRLTDPGSIGSGQANDLQTLPFIKKWVGFWP
jgi:hypothetical protein